MSKVETSHKRVGEILIEKGFLKRDQLDKALEIQRESSSQRLGQTLIRLGIITEDQLAECLAQQLGIPYIAMRSHQISDVALKLICKDMARRYGILPMDRIGNILTVAIYDELSAEEITELEKTTGCKLKLFFTTFSDFKASYTTFYPGETFMA